MRKKSYIKVLGLLILLVFMLTACSSKKSDVDNGSVNSSNSSNSSEGYEGKPQYTYDDDKESVSEEARPEDDVVKQDSLINNTGTSTSTSVFADMNRKLIRKIFFQLETQEFDQVMKTINSRINELGGYAEQSKTSGDSYYNGISTRVSDIIARIPKDKVNEFVYTVEGVANVISKEETAEDVTLNYVDIESHKKSLLIQQDRILDILEKTDKLKDIIELESRLSELRYQIEAYETNLRTLDNLIDYSTVTLKIVEVERITKPKVITTADRMRTGLEDNLYRIKNSFINFAVGLVVNIPYLFIWVIILAILVVIYKKVYKSKKIRHILGETKINKSDNQKDVEQ